MFALFFFSLSPSISISTLFFYSSLFLLSHSFIHCILCISSIAIIHPTPLIPLIRFIASSSSHPLSCPPPPFLLLPLLNRWTVGLDTVAQSTSVLFSRCVCLNRTINDWSQPPHLTILPPPQPSPPSTSQWSIAPLVLHHIAPSVH